jgi:hypothetical protein
MEIRRNYSVVRNAFDTDSGIVYHIDSYDTLSNNSVEQGTVRLIHSDTSIYFIFPILELLIDSIKLKVLDLPPTIGKSWEIINLTIDTTVFWLTIPINSNGSWILSMSIKDTVRYLYGGQEQKCYNVTSLSTGNGIAIIDSTVPNPLLPTDTIYEGDTVSWSESRADEEMYFSDMFTIPLWSSKVEIKYEINYFDTTSQADTLRKYTHVTSFYDPRTDRTVTK